MYFVAKKGLPTVYLVRARNETLSFVNRPLVGFQELLDRQGAYAVTWQLMFLPQLRRGGRFILELLFQDILVHRFKILECR